MYKRAIHIVFDADCGQFDSICCARAVRYRTIAASRTTLGAIDKPIVVEH